MKEFPELVVIKVVVGECLDCKWYPPEDDSGAAAMRAARDHTRLTTHRTVIHRSVEYASARGQP